MYFQRTRATCQVTASPSMSTSSRASKYGMALRTAPIDSISPDMTHPASEFFLVIISFCPAADEHQSYLLCRQSITVFAREQRMQTMVSQSRPDVNSAECEECSVVPSVEDRKALTSRIRAPPVQPPSGSW